MVCRVCECHFHRSCVQMKDFVSGTIVDEDCDLGWSCAECEDLYGLLSSDEKMDVAHLFDTISGK